MEAASLPHDRGMARPRRPAVPAVHALRRRRQLEVLGQRAVSPAARGLRRAAARRRRVAGVADRLRHARAVLRRGRASLPRARPGRRRSHRGPARAVSLPGGSARAADGGDRRGAAGARSASVGAAARTDPAGRDRRLPAVQHLQLVSVPHPRQERRRRPLRAPRARPAERHAVDRRARGAAGGVLVRFPRRRRGSGAGGGAPSRRGRAGDCGVRRREFGGPAVAIHGRRPPAGARQFIRARGAPLHGAPRDDDAGLPPLPEERHRVPEDGGRQRLLPDAAPRAIRSGRSSRRGGRTA